MSDNSSIEWTDATWNPVTGCTEVSSGCDHCYAKTFAERWRGTPGHHFEQGFDVVLRPERLDQPLRWRKPRRVFVNSMSDLFHDSVPDLFITRVFEIMEQASEHTFQVLTKRHARMRSFVQRRELDKQEYAAKFDQCPTEEMRNSPAAEYARNRAASPPANIWLGVSVEDQKWADIRVPVLLDTPAAVRWLSCEPLLGPVNLSRWLVSRPAWGPEYPEPTSPMGLLVQDLVDVPALSWVVCGGESGPGARPMDPNWARSLRDQCEQVKVPFFFKQWGNWVPPSQMPEGTFMSWDVENGTSAYDRDQPWRVGKKRAGRLLDGKTWNEYPSVEPAVSR